MILLFLRGGTLENMMKFIQVPRLLVIYLNKDALTSEFLDYYVTL